MMASSMELEKDRPFDALVDSVLPKIKEEFDSVIRHLRPPPYPYAIDAALAARGQGPLLLAGDGLRALPRRLRRTAATSSWPGVHKDVGTDRARLDVVSDEFIAAFDSSPLAAEGALVKSHGYAATPLTGVWANFPYLHNGSVPTLYHLLGPGRGAAGDLQRDGRPAGSIARGSASPVRRSRARSAERGGAAAPVRRRSRLVQHARDGSGNGGHDVWPRIRTDANRRAIIEYLKTL